jgi:hypothetical protein
VPATISAPSKQVRSYAVDAKASPTEVSSILEQRIRGVQEEAGLAETGRVLSVGYEISACTSIRVTGLRIKSVRGLEGLIVTGCL